MTAPRCGLHTAQLRHLVFEARVRIKALAGGLALACLLSGCGFDRPLQPQYPPTPAFTIAANQAFVLTVARGIDLNRGITIQRPTPLSFNNETINSVSFSVFNHTEEAIAFGDQGFGVRVYRFDAESTAWNAVQLKYHAEATPKVLPPKFEKWTLDMQNQWDISAGELQALPYRELRIYVSGVGKATGTHFGAYMDVTIGAP